MDDLIWRSDAIDRAKHAWAKGLEPSQYIELIPSAQTDLSSYSDRLWKRAYDRGYERCRQEAIELVHSLYPSAPIVRMNRERWKEKYKPYIEVEKMLDMLPSAQPYTEEEIQAMQDLEQAQIDKAYELGWKDGQDALREEMWEYGRDRLD